MDFFGIGSAIKGCAINYFAASRQTGKTTQLIESRQEGDRVVCLSEKRAEWIKRRAKDFNKNIEAIAVPLKDANKIFGYGTSEGRTIFDDDWVEAFYLLAIDRAHSDIDYFQKEFSGYGAAHVETKMAYQNAQKFNHPFR